jgi:hypothetical protein
MPKTWRVENARAKGWIGDSLCQAPSRARCVVPCGARGDRNQRPATSGVDTICTGTNMHAQLGSVATGHLKSHHLLYTSRWMASAPAAVQTTASDVCRRCELSRVLVLVCTCVTVHL